MSVKTQARNTNSIMFATRSRQFQFSPPPHPRKPQHFWMKNAPGKMQPKYHQPGTAESNHVALRIPNRPRPRTRDQFHQGRTLPSSKHHRFEFSRSHRCRRSLHFLLTRSLPPQRCVGGFRETAIVRSQEFFKFLGRS
jgi:hypothetical protein